MRSRHAKGDYPSVVANPAPRGAPSKADDVHSPGALKRGIRPAQIRERASEDRRTTREDGRPPQFRGFGQKRQGDWTLIIRAESLTKGEMALRPPWLCERDAAYFMDGG